MKGAASVVGLRPLTSDHSSSNSFSNGDPDSGLEKSSVQSQFEQTFGLVGSLLEMIGKAQGVRSQAVISSLSQKIDATNVAIVSTDIEGNVVYCNHHFVALWEIPPAIVATRKHSQYVAYCRQRLQEPTAWLSSASQIHLKDGRCIEQSFQRRYVNAQAVGQTWAYQTATCPDRLTQNERDFAGKMRNCSLADLAIASRQKRLADWFTRECSWLKNTDAAVFALYNQQLFATNLVAEAVTGYRQAEMFTLPQFKQMAAHFGATEGSAVDSGSPETVGASALLESSDRSEFRLTTKSGEDCWLRVAVQKRVVDGECLCLLSAIDITDLKQKTVRSRDLVAIDRHFSQQRSQLIAEITHQSLGALNLISMSADLLEAYGDSWGPHKKQTYNAKIRDAITKLSTQFQRMEKVDRLSLSQLAPHPDSKLLDRSTSELFDLTRTKSDPLDAVCTDIHKLCYQLVEAFKAKYQRHAFVTFCLSAEPKVCINQLYFQSILSHLIEALSLSAAASLVKVIVDLQPDSLVLRVYKIGFDITAEAPSRDESQRQLSEVETSSAAASEVSGSSLTFVESLLEIAEGVIVVERQRKHTVATVKLSLAMLANQQICQIAA